MRDDASASLADRVITAVIAAFFGMVTVLAIPMAVAWHYGGYPITRLYRHQEFWAWACVVAVAAAIAGFLLGSARAAALFGHLWGTEHPPREWLTLTLWLVLIGLGVVGYHVLN